MIEGNITGTGTTSSTQLSGKFDLSLTGFGTATVTLERSIDGGVTYGTVESFTADSQQVGESAGGAHFRLNCTAYTSGTIRYRLSR